MGHKRRVSDAGRPEPLPPGLYIVATPIGNLGDVTRRSAEVLARCDAVACEDTRVTGKLLRHLGLSKPLWRYDDHSAADDRARLLAAMEHKAVALVSDAGTPLVSDPGYKLVREARAAGVPVTSLPGPSAPVVALTLSGLPSDRFLFAGFLPGKDKARAEMLAELAGVRATLLFFETAPRLGKSLEAIGEVLPSREVAVARELTKLYETVLDGTLAALASRVATDPDQRRGEFVVLVQGAGSDEDARIAEGRRLYAKLGEHLPPSTAAKLAAELSGAPRKALYGSSTE